VRCELWRTVVPCVKEVFNLDNYFAVTAPGLESFTTQELTTLGFCLFPPLKQLLREGLHSKATCRRSTAPTCTAHRQPHTARLGTFFYATTFPELQKRAPAALERCLTPGQPIVLRVTCHQSKLYNSEPWHATYRRGWRNGWGKQPAGQSR